LTAFTSLKHLKKDLPQGNTICIKIVDTYLQTIKQNLNLNTFLEIFVSEASDESSMIRIMTHDIKEKELYFFGDFLMDLN